MRFNSKKTPSAATGSKSISRRGHNRRFSYSTKPAPPPDHLPRAPRPSGQDQSTQKAWARFHEHLRSGNEDAALNAAADLIRGRSSESVRSTIHKFRKQYRANHLAAFERDLGIQLLVQAFFEERGALLNFEGEPYLQAEDGNVLELHRDSESPSRALLPLGVRTTDKIYPIVAQGLRDAALLREGKKDLCWFGHLDPAKSLVHIHDQGSTAFQITSESIGRIPLSSSPVGFRRIRPSQEFLLQEATTRRFQDEILGIIPFEDGAFPADHQRLLLWAYVVSLLIPGYFPTRPILLAIGPTNSCKTSTLRLLGRTLLGPRFDVMPEPGSTRDLTAVIQNHYIAAFDNIDTGLHKKLIDFLCGHATGGSSNNRKLYTDCDVVEVPFQNHLWLSSRNASFSRDDLATRFLPIQLRHTPMGQRVTERELQDRVSEGRETYLSELATDLQRFLARKCGHPTTFPPITRMADFDVFAQELAAAHGQHAEMMNALNSMKMFQAIQRRTGEVLFPILDAWLAVDGNLGREIRQKELHDELLQISQGTQYAGHLEENSQRFGNLLTKLSTVLETDYGHVKEIRGGDQPWHTFTRMPNS